MLLHCCWHLFCRSFFCSVLVGGCKIQVFCYHTVCVVKVGRTKRQAFSAAEIGFALGCARPAAVLGVSNQTGATACNVDGLG